MDIQGLQSMTLLDWPGKVACTVFLGGCQLRCPYCHNAQLLEGPFPSAMTQRELLGFLEKRRGLLDGVCLTGGEPLLRPDLDGLLEGIKALGYPVKLDTNGTHPQRLAALWQRGLVDYVAMDVKNSPSRYPQTTGVPGLDLAPIRASLDWLLEGRVDYELRTTAVRQFHDGEAFRELGGWIRGARRYYIQNFTPRDTVLCPGLSGFDREELEGFARLVAPFVEQVELRGV
ncbi:MAG TPA: anaerobic ribonucleoside-triphosphate reductase activating protein [Candidatus Enterenecus merdae]|nr:anaerobic ribonucleoside-triphosphate reductase activating protein [Candidatus Enterenecus merdae]